MMVCFYRKRRGEADHSVIPPTLQPFCRPSKMKICFIITLFVGELRLHKPFFEIMLFAENAVARRIRA